MGICLEPLDKLRSNIIVIRTFGRNSQKRCNGNRLWRQ